jgi:D-inositol-3-phosphate glycosyltransferase
MRALYFNHMPQRLEDQKAESPDTVTLMGGRLFPAEALKAILNHSSVDKIFLPEPAQVGEKGRLDLPLFAHQSSRLSFISEQELPSLRKFDHVVFMTPGLELADMARLRRIARCDDAIAMAFIHSINSPFMLRFFMLLALSQLRESDALVCSSSAGLTAVKNFNNLLMQRISSCGWQMPAPQYQLPLIPIGVDTSEYQLLAADSLRRDLNLRKGPIALYFGRFSHTSKGDLLPLILAFAEVLETCPEANMIIAGDDSQHHLTPELQKVATRLSCEDRIKILANPDAAMKKNLYSVADFFVSPSDSLQETFGITIVEAMASGLPVVVSDWNGYKDIVEDGVTGFRISTTVPTYPPLFDEMRGSSSMLDVDLLAATTVVDFHQLVARMAQLFTHEQLRDSMGSAARARARQKFDWSVVVSSYEALWDELAMKSSSDRSSPGALGLDLDSYSCQQIFSHYATRELTPDGLLRVAGDVKLEHLEFSLLSSMGWFSGELCTRLLQIVREHGVVSCRTLLAILETDTERQEVLNFAHISRLIKYGLLDLVP